MGLEGRVPSKTSPSGPKVSCLFLGTHPRSVSLSTEVVLVCWITKWPGEWCVSEVSHWQSQGALSQVDGAVVFMHFWSDGPLGSCFLSSGTDYSVCVGILLLLSLSP